MKIMISQPMNGKTEEQIRKERAELVKELEKVPYWTKIEYIDIENDIKIIGWVSTRCIKSYNQFKSEFNDIEE